jgi:hypothetical protein
LVELTVVGLPVVFAVLKAAHPVPVLEHTSIGCTAT